MRTRLTHKACIANERMEGETEGWKPLPSFYLSNLPNLQTKERILRKPQRTFSLRKAAEHFHLFLPSIRSFLPKNIFLTLLFVLHVSNKTEEGVLSCIL